MPTIAKGDLVLVTGASGFIAAHTVKEFLSKGYKVRGTVRSKDKGEYLRNLFEGQGQFDYVLVKDIAEDGAFDEAVKDVDAVAHTASPFHFNAKDPKELIEPAVSGTTGILKSIQKNNSKVKRVVITSSVAAVMSTRSRKGAVHYTEADWNQDSVPHVEEKGKEADTGDMYRASKTLAEQAFWKFIKEEKPSWDGATVNPPLVLGEVIHQCDSAESLNTSVAAFYAWAAGKKSESDLPGALGNWVNVRDVAQAHVRALEVEEAGGERFIAGAGALTGQAYCDILHKHFPELKNIPTGKPGTHDQIAKDISLFDGAKATKVLGIKYATLEDTTVEMYESLKGRKFL